MKHSLQIAGLILEFPHPFLPKRKDFGRRRETQRQIFGKEQGEKLSACGGAFSFSSLPRFTGWSVGFSCLVFQSLLRLGLAGICWEFVRLWSLFAVWEGRAWHGVGDGSTGDSAGDTVGLELDPSAAAIKTSFPSSRGADAPLHRLSPSFLPASATPIVGSTSQMILEIFGDRSPGQCLPPPELGCLHFSAGTLSTLGLFIMNCGVSRNGGSCLALEGEISLPGCPLEVGQQICSGGSECCRVRMSLTQGETPDFLYLGGAERGRREKAGKVGGKRRHGCEMGSEGVLPHTLRVCPTL